MTAFRWRFEWQPRDLWVGVYWERRPHACDFDTCWNNSLHVWVCLLPALPLHLSWLYRTTRKGA